MTWYLAYREDSWIKKFESKFWAESKNAFDDPENACAEAISQLLMKTLPEAKLKHRENLDAYVMVTFGRVVSDLIRQYSGRLRAPSMLEKLGGPYRKIFHEFCIEKNPLDVIADKLQLPMATVWEIVNWLKTKNKCPQERRKLSLSDETEAASIRGHEALMDLQADPENQQIENFRKELISLIAFWIFDEESPNTAGVESDTNLQLKLSSLSLPPISTAERLLIKLVYLEGQSMSETARILQVSRKVAQAQHDKVLASMNTLLKNNGISF